MKVLKLSDLITEKAKIETKTLTDNIIEIFSESIGSDDKTLIKKAISSYISDEESIAIKGLVNDSDVYDFFVKYTTDIDNTLRDINHYDKSPNSLNALGIYDYIIISTKIAIKEELVKYLKK